VIFEISRDVCQGAGQWDCRLDFMPDVGREVLLEELKRRRETAALAEDLLTGILHNRLGRVLTQNAGIKNQRSVASLENWELERVADTVKCLEVALTEPMGMDSAQVTAGGIVTAEFEPNTMQSRLVPNLYACGEVLDVDGDCGGYNLQWAWSSGRMAGYHAAEGKI
jgi:predicted Rossmann fold flavoprotein